MGPHIVLQETQKVTKRKGIKRIKWNERKWKENDESFFFLDVELPLLNQWREGSKNNQYFLFSLFHVRSYIYYLYLPYMYYSSSFRNFRLSFSFPGRISSRLRKKRHGRWFFSSDDCSACHVRWSSNSTTSSDSYPTLLCLEEVIKIDEKKEKRKNKYATKHKEYKKNK